jgi:hypothetical protein
MGGRVRVGRLVSFSFTIGGDGRTELGEGGCEVVRGVDKGSAGVADGDAYNSTRIQYRRKALSKGRCLFGVCGQAPSHAETTLLAAASARSLSFMFACPLILCGIVVILNSVLYRRDSTIAFMSGLWW